MVDTPPACTSYYPSYRRRPSAVANLPLRNATIRLDPGNRREGIDGVSSMLTLPAAVSHLYRVEDEFRWPTV
jgi:hypothetical protein